METIDINEATAEQLRRFGATMLGLEITGRETKEQMRGKFAEIGYGPSFIKLGEPSPAPSGGPDQQAGAFNRRTNPETGKEEVRITIHRQDKPGGDRPVEVNVNGQQMVIPRGEPQWVPTPYVEALNNAEEWAYAEYAEGLGGLGEPRKVKSYPFSFA